MFGPPPRHPLTPQTPLATPQLRGLLAIPPASGQAPGATPWPTLSPRASVPLPPPPPSLLRRQLLGPRGLHWSPWRKQLLSQAARPLPPLQATAPASIGPVASLTGLFVCHLPSPLECNCREGPRSRIGSSASYRLGAGVRYAPQRSVALPVSQASRWQRPHGHFWAVAPHCSGRIKVIFPRHGLVLPGGESGCWAGGEPRARRHHIPRGPAPDGQQGCAPGPSLTRPLSSAWKAPRVLGPAGEEDEHNPPFVSLFWNVLLSSGWEQKSECPLLGKRWG